MTIIFLQGLFLTRLFLVGKRSMPSTTLSPEPVDLRFVEKARGNSWGGLRRIFEVVRCTTRAVRAILKNEKEKGATSESLKERHAVMVGWARNCLDILGIHVRTQGRASETPCLIVGNHFSYLDIPLMMAVTPTVYVAKKQLESWPVFGHAMKTVGTVFVERDSRDSRKGAADAIAPRILNDKQTVTIFPSGTTTLDEIKPWRWGAFVIAKRHGIPIQPVRIRYSPLRKAAFIGNDLFLTHLWRLATCPGGMTATLEFGEPFFVTDPQADATKWWNWCREGM